MKISIVTPSYNQGYFIEKTIQSVITQDYTPLEYIIIDNKSTDHTLEIIKRYQHHLSWISEADGGQSHAINKGISCTSGEIIGWLNSDDIYYPDTIKKVCQFFANHPEIDILYGDADYIDREGRLIGPYPTEPWNRERIKSRCFISQPATFFRRRLIAKHGLIDENLVFCMDYEYWLRLSLNNAKFAYFPHLLAGSRMYAETKTSRYCLEASVEAITMLKKRLGYIPSEWVVNYSSAKVKSVSNLRYPQIRFIAAVWLNLWKSTGPYYQDSTRISVWFGAQYAMLRRFLRKTWQTLLTRLKKRVD